MKVEMKTFLSGKRTGRNNLFSTRNFLFGRFRQHLSLFWVTTKCDLTLYLKRKLTSKAQAHQKELRFQPFEQKICSQNVLKAIKMFMLREMCMLTQKICACFISVSRTSHACLTRTDVFLAKISYYFLGFPHCRGGFL